MMISEFSFNFKYMLPLRKKVSEIDFDTVLFYYTFSKDKQI